MHRFCRLAKIQSDHFSFASRDGRMDYRTSAAACVLKMWQARPVFDCVLQETPPRLYCTSSVKCKSVIQPVDPFGVVFHSGRRWRDAFVLFLGGKWCWSLTSCLQRYMCLVNLKKILLRILDLLYGKSWFLSRTTMWPITRCRRKRPSVHRWRLW